MASFCTSESVEEIQIHMENIFNKVTDKKKFKKSIRTLRRNVINLNSFCVGFVRSLHRQDWRNYDPPESIYMIKLVMDIFSAHPFTIKEGIEGLVKSIHTLSEVAHRQVILDEISLLFSFLVDICPLSKSYLLESLSENLPFYTRPKPYIVNFFSFLFAILKNIPELRIYIYSLIIQSLIHIDTELPKQKIERNIKFLNNMKQKNVSIEAVYKKFKNVEKSTLLWIETCDKLDDIMLLCFQIFSSTFEIMQDDTSFYHDLRTAFLEKILSCRGLIAVHFIWFYFCSRSQTFLELTLSDLWSKFSNVNEAIHIRHVTLTHISGILARGLFIKFEIFETYIRLMFSWVFYSLIWWDKSVNRENEDILNWIKFLTSLDFDRIILSKLNPLYYCSHGVFFLLENFRFPKK
ncbi:hypothetical protein MXB_5563 [Myxobolus squamalis]|nr:hypothetical protein MXB_5563 [Myxobolus squamalis]